MQFYVKDLSIWILVLDFGGGSWNQSPMDTERQQYFFVSDSLT